MGALPTTFPAAIVVVQHGRNDPDTPDRLARINMPVATACTGQRLPETGVVVVPPGSLTTVSPHGVLSVRPDHPERIHCGDDVLTGLASAVGSRSIGVVLTGLGNDGARGVRAVKRHGGRVLVQDPADAYAPAMPINAIATGCVDFILPLDRIAPALIALTMAPGAADLLTVPAPHWAAIYS